MIRVLVADDQPMIRSALSALIAAAPDIDVVGEAADGRAAVDAARRLVPDVVLMDVRMPNMNGLTATACIRAEQPQIAVLVLTTYELDEYVFEAIRSGASGLLLKDGDADELVRAIRSCANGDAVMAPGPLRRLLDEFARHPRPDPTAAALIDTLTPRELEVLGHITAGLSNEQIAHALIVSKATVKSHVGAVLTKLGARDRTQATVIAHRAGMARQHRA
jgi:DNA-binding NarL/FixJ family response regulator